VQRVDVPPLDEALGYAALIELQPDTYTVESIAPRVGRPPTYVSGRLRLIQLIAEAKQAFYEDKLTVAHAFEIARLQPNDQRRALQECFPQYRNAAAILKDKKAEATTVRELRAWIERGAGNPSGPHQRAVIRRKTSIKQRLCLLGMAFS
jgi:ParB family transcriptional regulator, chromosome partitioning protein